MFDVDSVLEEQLFPHPVQGGSGMSMQDVDQGFCSQMSTNQVDLNNKKLKSSCCSTVLYYDYTMMNALAQA